MIPDSGKTVVLHAPVPQVVHKDKAEQGVALCTCLSGYSAARREFTTRLRPSRYLISQWRVALDKLHLACLILEFHRLVEAW